MIRMPLIAGNWKMFKTNEEAERFCEEFKRVYRDTDVQALICCPFTCIQTVKKCCAGTKILVGAQNVHFRDDGAFTGEISVPMLAELGVDFCIVGHSERRQYFNETDEDVNRKLKALLKGGIRPILCVGESLETREAWEEESFVEGQLRSAFENIEASEISKIVIAYEPVWAIGTGKTATAEQAGAMCAFIRKVLIDLYGEDEADDVIILYGGSVKPDNIRELMDDPEIDGALVGGASLDAARFMDIIDF